MDITRGNWLTDIVTKLRSIKKHKTLPVPVYLSMSGSVEWNLKNNSYFKKQRLWHLFNGRMQIDCVTGM